MYKPKGPTSQLAMTHMTGEIKLFFFARAAQTSGGQKTCCAPPRASATMARVSHEIPDWPNFFSCSVTLKSARDQR